VVVVVVFITNIYNGFTKSPSLLKAVGITAPFKNFNVFYYLVSPYKYPSVRRALDSHHDNNFVNPYILVNLVNRGLKYCYIKCYYKFAIVLSLLSSRISYIYVFVLHFCIVDFNFYLLHCARSVIRSCSKNRKLNYFVMMIIIIFITNQ
jgi:hypothetical protein